jgi:hypothetical protein
MDWHPIPNQNANVLLELSFGEDGVTGGWQDEAGASVSAGVIDAPSVVDAALTPMSAITEWTAFSSAPEKAAADWFEEAVPLADTLADGVMLSGVVDVSGDGSPASLDSLDGLVDHTTDGQIATDGLSDGLTGGQVVVLGEGAENASAESTSPVAPVAGTGIIIFEFLS